VSGDVAHNIIHARAIIRAVGIDHIGPYSPHRELRGLQEMMRA
jgi:hypothetical protein